MLKSVYQLSDLVSREILDAGAEKPARLAVIGTPVKHSASPEMHQAALDEAGVNMRYIRLEIKPGKVAEALNQMKQLGFLGCNLTVPHKFEAMDFCDSLTEDARAIGAINTILFEEENTLGHNTDAPGLARAIYEEFGVDLGDLKVMILGAGGGAGRAIATQCARLGCDQLWLVNRTVEKAESLKETLQTYYKNKDSLAVPGDPLNILSSTDSEIAEATGHADLIINASSMGMKASDPIPLPIECIQPHHLVYDVIYNPPITAFLAQAKSKGARTANGLSMLLYQGILAFELWFPGKSNKEAMRRGLTHAISQ